MTRRCAALLLLGALAASGCATPWWLHLPPRLADCPGAIPSTEALPAGDLVWRDRVRYRGDRVDVGFALVAEKRGDRLALVALNAFGARVLSLVQQGHAVEVDARLGPLLQVPPETLLRDWHTARAAGVEPPGSVAIARPACGYEASFVAESRAFLGDPE